MLPKLELGASRQDCLDGPAGGLEFKLEMPATAPWAVALICHPHPLYQGSMDNKVAYTLARIALATGCVALRFQFRGVGRSAGVHDHGDGEAQDADFLLAQLGNAFPDLPQVLMGFSFGAYMALKVAAQHSELAALITIAPPLVYAGDGPVPQPLAPWLMIHGDADDVVPFEATQTRALAMATPPTIHRITGAGHFFHGQLNDVRKIAEPWLDSVLNQAVA